MASYVTHIEDANSISDLASATLITIKRLDESCKKLSNQIDHDIKQGKSEEIIQMRELLDDLTERKASLAMQAYDYLDKSTRKADEDMELVETAIRAGGYVVPSVNDVLKQFGVGDQNGKKSSKTTDLLILQPNEPLYCICRQIAHGEMISCDNPACEVEWFHYQCVGLSKAPRNQWFCPICSSTAKRRRY